MAKAISTLYLYLFYVKFSLEVNFADVVTYNSWFNFLFGNKIGA